ncbi:hypothetical protein D3C80_1517480 [compost metagenome]
MVIPIRMTVFGFIPDPSNLATSGMATAVQSAPGIMNIPVCVAVQPNEICTNNGKINTVPKSINPSMKFIIDPMIML